MISTKFNSIINKFLTKEAKNCEKLYDELSNKSNSELQFILHAAILKKNYYIKSNSLLERIPLFLTTCIAILAIFYNYILPSKSSLLTLLIIATLCTLGSTIMQSINIAASQYCEMQELISAELLNKTKEKSYNVHITKL